MLINTVHYSYCELYLFYFYVSLLFYFSDDVLDFIRVLVIIQYSIPLPLSLLGTGLFVGSTIFAPILSISANVLVASNTTSVAYV